MVFAALILIFLVGGLSGQASATKSEVDNGHGDRSEQQNSYENPPKPAKPTPATEGVKREIVAPVSADNKKNAETSGDQKNPDLIAQEAMALWAMVMGISAILTVLVTSAGLWFLRGTLIATNKTLEHTEATTKAVLMEQRAWLAFEILGVEIYPDGRGVEIKLEVKNTGKTPALTIEIYSRRVKHLWGELSDLEAVEQLISSPRMGEDEMLLFHCLPGNKFKRTIRSSDPDPLAGEVMVGDEIDYREFPRRIAIAIFYDVNESRMKHHTAFAVVVEPDGSTSISDAATRVR